MDEAFNDVLAAAAEKAVAMGPLADNLSVGTALSVMSDSRPELAGEAQHRLFQWHIANIEFANAMLADKLSVSKWSLDDAFDFDGDHVWLPGGNVRLVAALAEGVPVVYNSAVKQVRYCSAGVEVDTEGVTYKGVCVLGWEGVCEVVVGCMQQCTCVCICGLLVLLLVRMSTVCCCLSQERWLHMNTMCCHSGCGGGDDPPGGAKERGRGL